jgi:hypothetical protein
MQLGFFVAGVVGVRRGGAVVRRAGAVRRAGVRAAVGAGVALGVVVGAGIGVGVAVAGEGGGAAISAAAVRFAGSDSGPFVASATTPMTSAARVDPAAGSNQRRRVVRSDIAISSRRGVDLNVRSELEWRV